MTASSFDAAMLAFFVVVKLVSEIALLAMSGQWVLGLLAGSAREQNFFYKLLETTGKPAHLLGRVLCPASWTERSRDLVSFLAVALVWMGATVLKIHACLQIGIASCR